MRKTIVSEGNSDKVVERFSKAGVIEEQAGFVDLAIMVKKVRSGNEEVIIMIRWESEEDWKNWEKSEVHMAGHKANAGKPKPEFYVSSEAGLYEVKAVKKAVKNN